MINTDNWYEKLGKSIACELCLEEDSEIEHQCGTIWVTNSDKETIVISGFILDPTEII